MLAAPNISSGGSINKSDHNARGRPGKGADIRQGSPRSLSPGAWSLSNARESKLNGSHQPRRVLRRNREASRDSQADFLGLGHGPAALITFPGFLF